MLIKDVKQMKLFRKDIHGYKALLGEFDTLKELLDAEKSLEPVDRYLDARQQRG